MAEPNQRPRGGNLVLKYRSGRISLPPWDDEDEQLLGALVLNLDYNPDLRQKILKEALRGLLDVSSE